MKQCPDSNLLNKISTKEKWNNIYKKQGVSIPANVLLNHHYLLPTRGCALDLACGLGANALYLAKKGLDTHAWDISTVALNQLQQNAVHTNLKINVKQLEIDSSSLPINTFDVIVISRYLDRTLCKSILASLNQGGLLFYQTYVRDKIDSTGPKNPDYLLARNELLGLFSELKLVFYHENSLLGNTNIGERNEALYIGQKC